MFKGVRTSDPTRSMYVPTIRALVLLRIMVSTILTQLLPVSLSHRSSLAMCNVELPKDYFPDQPIDVSSGIVREQAGVIEGILSLR